MSGVEEIVGIAAAGIAAAGATLTVSRFLIGKGGTATITPGGAVSTLDDEREKQLRTASGGQLEQFALIRYEWPFVIQTHSALSRHIARVGLIPNLSLKVLEKAGSPKLSKRAVENELRQLRESRDLDPAKVDKKSRNTRSSSNRWRSTRTRRICSHGTPSRSWPRSHTRTCAFPPSWTSRSSACATTRKASSTTSTRSGRPRSRSGRPRVPATGSGTSSTRRSTWSTGDHIFLVLRRGVTDEQAARELTGGA